MSTAPDITVTIIFHREGSLAIPALGSLKDIVDVARGAGLEVEAQAVLDRADESTRRIVAQEGEWIDDVEEVSFGDLGLTRNAGSKRARGRYLAFVDGDDLWGRQWLRAAFAAATMPGVPEELIWHPEHLFVFNADDVRGSSFFSLMSGSDEPEFDPALLFFDNLWSANVFARREIYLRFPYREVDWNNGIGIEDWSWNFATLGAGIHHRVVPGTVHLIRRKGGASLGQQAADRLLPHLPESLIWGRRWP